MLENRFSRNAKIILTVFFLSMYVIGASVQAFYVNTDMSKADQSDYLSRAISLKTDLYKNMTEGNRMPAYPYLISYLYHPGLSMAGYFQRGKIFNIILSVLLLFPLYIIFKSYLSSLEAQVLLLITAFTVFMPRAGYVQCELLYYFLNFCTFVLFWGSLKKPRLWITASAGLLAGLSYLTKAAMLPAVGWFVVCYFIIHIAGPVFQDVAKKIYQKTNLYRGQVWKNILFLGAFVLIFAVTITPYIRVNKQVFGTYFYNVNSTFYIWYDSWDEVVKGTRAHGDRQGWPQMPAEEIPNAGKYLQEHTVSQVLARLGNGFIIITTNALGGFGYAQYLCIYLFICIYAIMSQYGAFKEYLKHNNNAGMAISLCSYFLGYFLLYGFGGVIFKGPRHPLAQYVPLLFTMFYFLARFGPSYYSQKFKYLFTMREIHFIVINILMLDLAFHIPYKLYQIFLGW
jgi:hypothetical protein